MRFVRSSDATLLRPHPRKSTTLNEQWMVRRLRGYFFVRLRITSGLCSVMLRWVQTRVPSEVILRGKVTLAVSLLALPVFVRAQETFARRWEERASATLAKQPPWPAPLVTASTGLIQLYRADFVRQTASNHVQSWNLDGGKGLNLIPLPNTELDLNLSPFVKHSSPASPDGFGDTAFLLRYRFLAGSSERGNYVASIFLSGTLPTGSYKNGAADATVSPNIAIGKGAGIFDVQSVVGASLPVMETAKLGRTVTWNTAIQAHVAKHFWPEVEFNSAFYKGGPNDGKNQTFATPALLVAQKLKPQEPRSRLAVCVGAGEQIATSRFHTYNHGIVVTTRLLF